MKTKIIIACICALLPLTLLAQEKTIFSLVESYSTHKDVEYTKANKAIIWMAKASAPKGALDGVKEMEILNFKGGSTSSTYKAFRSAALQIFESSAIECVSDEKGDKGSAEVFLNPTPPIQKYMMFMHNDDGSEVFMLLQGDELAAPAPKGKKK